MLVHFTYLRKFVLILFKLNHPYVLLYTEARTNKAQTNIDYILFVFPATIPTLMICVLRYVFPKIYIYFFFFSSEQTYNTYSSERRTLLLNDNNAIKYMKYTTDRNKMQ